VELSADVKRRRFYVVSGAEIKVVVYMTKDKGKEEEKRKKKR
jgi:hypothetical protein